MRAFGYGRVSTDKQELSPEVQRKACESWINYAARSGRFSEGLDVGGWYFDNATSAKKYPFFERMAAQTLMMNIKPGDIIVVSNFDRIFRSTLDCCIVMEHMEANGIGMVIIDADFDTTTPIGRACVKIISVIKELEREEIVRRIKDANRELIVRGGYVGRPPLGWKKGPVKNDIRTLVPCNKTRKLCKKMSEMKETMTWDQLRQQIFRDTGIRFSGNRAMQDRVSAHRNGYPTQQSRLLAKIADEKALSAQQPPSPAAPVVVGHLSLEPPSSSAQSE